MNFLRFLTFLVVFGISEAAIAVPSCLETLPPSTPYLHTGQYFPFAYVRAFDMNGDYDGCYASGIPTKSVCVSYVVDESLAFGEMRVTATLSAEKNLEYTTDINVVEEDDGYNITIEVFESQGTGPAPNPSAATPPSDGATSIGNMNSDAATGDMTSNGDINSDATGQVTSVEVSGDPTDITQEKAAGSSMGLSSLVFALTDDPLAAGLVAVLNFPHRAQAQEPSCRVLNVKIELPCLRDACMNGGVHHIDQCGCNCSIPWTGETCAVCGRVCENNGTLNSNTCQCACADGFAGATCSDTIDTGACANPPATCGPGSFNTTSCACECPPCQNEGELQPDCSCKCPTLCNETQTHFSEAGEQQPDCSCFCSFDCNCDSCPDQGNCQCLIVPIGRPYVPEEGPTLPTTQHTQSDWIRPLKPHTDSLSTEELKARETRWVRQGEGEQASVASFAHFTLELLSLGAPASLVEAAQAAGADERRHAELCYGLASAYAGEPLSPGVYPPTTLHIGQDTLSTLTAVVEEGCVAETLAALAAAREAKTETDPVVRAVLEEISEDERRHAALAWETIQWAIKRFPAHKAPLETKIRELTKGIPSLTQLADLVSGPLSGHCNDSETEATSVGVAELLAELSFASITA